MKVTGNLFESKMRPEQVFRLMKACAIVRWLGLSTTNTAICCSLGVVKEKMPQNDPKGSKRPHIVKVTGNLFEAKMRPEQVFRLMKACAIVRWLGLSTTNTAICCSLGVVKEKMPQNDTKGSKRHHIMKVTGNLFEAKMRPEQVFRLMKACAIVRWLGLSTTNTAICCSLGVVKEKMPQNDTKGSKRHHIMKVTGNLFEAKMRPEQVFRLMKACAIVRWLGLSTTNTAICCSLGVVKEKMPQNDPKGSKRPHIMKVTGNLFESKMRPEQVFRLMKACAIVRWLGLSTTNTAICCSLGVVKEKMPQNDTKGSKRHHIMKVTGNLFEAKMRPEQVFRLMKACAIVRWLGLSTTNTAICCSLGVVKEKMPQNDPKGSKRPHIMKVTGNLFESKMRPEQVFRLMKACAIVRWLGLSTTNTAICCSLGVVKEKVFRLMPQNDTKGSKWAQKGPTS
jgi:uncharacterized protein (DUF697 family)